MWLKVLETTFKSDLILFVLEALTIFFIIYVLAGHVILLTGALDHVGTRTYITLIFHSKRNTICNGYMI